VLLLKVGAFHETEGVMSWFRIRFTRNEASTLIGDLAQDFLDTLQTSESRDGIALYRQKQIDGEDQVVYYLSLNTSRPSKRLTDVYKAEPCSRPERHIVDHFGGDNTVLGPEG
jgi:hypothetical protein